MRARLPDPTSRAAARASSRRDVFGRGDRPRRPLQRAVLEHQPCLGEPGAEVAGQRREDRGSRRLARGPRPRTGRRSVSRSSRHPLQRASGLARMLVSPARKIHGRGRCDDAAATCPFEQGRVGDEGLFRRRCTAPAQGVDERHHPRDVLTRVGGSSGRGCGHCRDCTSHSCNSQKLFDRLRPAHGYRDTCKTYVESVRTRRRRTP